MTLTRKKLTTRKYSEKIPTASRIEEELTDQIDPLLNICILYPMSDMLWLVALLAIVGIVKCKTCTSGYTYYSSTDSCYKFVSTELNYADATQSCSDNSNGWLATINDSNENELLFFPKIYRKTQSVNNEYFYKGLFNILSNKFNYYIYDKPQISGSCSFYSVYYFIKYFIFDYTNILHQSKFNNFINKIKEFIINIYLKQNIYDHINISSDDLNISYALIKDYEFEDKQRLINFLSDKILLNSNLNN